MRSILRPALAALCCLIAAGAMFYEASLERFDLPIQVGVGVVAAMAGVLLVVRRFWAALAGRGLVWTALAMVTLFGSADHPRKALTATALALCAALLVAGRHTLDRAPSTFQPTHHRGPLILALVLGFADVVTLTGWSLLAFFSGGTHVMWIAVTFLGIAVAIAISLAGLYRLRTWGFLLNLAVNLAVTILMVFDVFHVDFLRLVFIVPAVAQILIALPVLVAIIRHKPIAVPALVSRVAAFVPTVAILTMAALNLQVWYGRPVLIQLVRWGMRHF